MQSDLSLYIFIISILNILIIIGASFFIIPTYYSIQSYLIDIMREINIRPTMPLKKEKGGENQVRIKPTYLSDSELADLENLESQ